MQIIETSDGIVIFGVITENDQQETYLNHDEVLELAYKNPSKQIIVSDSPAFLVNNEVYLSLLSEGQPENITVSGELWSKLHIGNFKSIRKSAIKKELGNVIGNEEDSIDRAKAALEILTPHGMENVKINNNDGKEEIAANVDGKECVINISLGRSNNFAEENVLYDDQIGTNLRLTITTEENSYPDCFTYRMDGIKYKKVYEDSNSIIYTPDKLDRLSRKTIDKIERVSKLDPAVDREFYGAMFNHCADLTDLPQEIIYPYNDYAVVIDGDLYYHNNGSNIYSTSPTQPSYFIFPSIKINK